MYCSHCGVQIAEQAVVCPKCGCATHNFPGQMVAPSDRRTRSPGTASTDLITAGYIASFIFPIAGFIIAIVAMVKGKVGHGAAMVFLSLFMSYCWLNFWIGFSGG